MKKKKIFPILIIISVCGLSALITYNTGFFAPSTLQAVNSKSPEFTSTRNELKEIPIMKNKIFKANANYKSLSGTILVKNIDDTQSEVKLWISQPDKFKIEYTPNINQPDIVQIAVNDGSVVQTKDSVTSNISSSEPIKKRPKPTNIQDDEIVPDYNGTFYPIGGVNELIHPEMFEGVFRSGKLTIVGDENFLGRDVTVLNVDLSNAKLGNCHRFWVDKDTGVVLKTEICDNENVLYSAAFQTISFSDDVSVANYKLFK